MEGGFGVSWVAVVVSFSPRVSEFRDLRLNRTGFQVLRCVAGCGFGHFCAWISGILLKIPILWGFRSHTVHVVN